MKKYYDKCPESEIIMAYIEKGLTNEETPLVEEHLMVCNRCLKEAISLSRGTTIMSQGKNILLPNALKEKALSISKSSKRARYLSEFIISLSEKAISFTKTVLKPEEALVDVFSSKDDAFAFRGGEDSGDILKINQKINDIYIRVQFYNAEGLAASLRVSLQKKELPLIKTRLSLYRDERLFSSKTADEEGDVIFRDITYGYYRIIIPEEDIEIAFKVLPPGEI